MNPLGKQPTLRLPPVFVVRALWLGVALLVAIGLSSVVGRGVFTGDFATRADPYRQRGMEAFHRQDPLASTRPAELDRFDRRFADAPFVTMLHILPGGLLLVLAPLQFSSRIRNRHIRFHRWSGRLLVGTAVVSTLAGLYFGLLMPYGGLGEAAATTLFGGILLVSVIRAVAAIRRGQVALHREWMIRAFAIVLGISMVRVVGPVFDLAFTPAGLPPRELFVLSLWTGWTLTLAAAEAWIRYTRVAVERPAFLSGAVGAEASLQ
ncbi:MAG: DUF2306 domain-containing protein [Acidobacteriota bacterium]|nr:DUF2306 domain-containing protein [Acidobacteriota bacterium]